MIDLNKLAEALTGISKAREQNGAVGLHCDTMSLLKHTATEVVEATEAWVSNGAASMQFKCELADIIVCVLIIAHLEHVDIESALHVVYEKNKKRAEGTGDKK